MNIEDVISIQDVDVVEGLLLVIHRVVVDIQLRDLVELAGELLGGCKLSRGDTEGTRTIELIVLIRLVDGREVLVEGIDNLLQLRNRTVVVGIGHEDDA